MPTAPQVRVRESCADRNRRSALEFERLILLGVIEHGNDGSSLRLSSTLIASVWFYEFPSGNDRSDDERRVPRERNADVFQADDTGNYKQAVGVNEVGDGRHEDR